MNDRGSASLAVLGVAALLLVLAIGLAAVGSYLVARAEAEVAADAAALAAAPVTFLPFGALGTPEDEAVRFAAFNNAGVTVCRCQPDPSWEPRTIEVTAVRRITIWPLGTYEVSAVGRAEFVPALLLG